MTNSIFKGIAAGFAATFIMSLAMYFGADLREFPALIVTLTGISHRVIGSPLWDWIGWAYHFAIGTLAWGILFGLLAGAIRVRSGFGAWFTAIVFAVCAWVLMMIIVMPLAGLGFFALGAGLDIFFSMLILHIIWGTVLGLTFYAMTKPEVIEHRVHERTAGAPIFRRSRREPAPRAAQPPPPIEEPTPRGGERL
ncbi:MAG: DUF1440 domain-containing protein [Gammaproteobacteria bacterium]|nr:DUF1440 domain-containing protein [Gammaproteobacteria bacterium]